ncbi:MAG: hypothetical protein ABJA57_00810 [Ginsengibacter sp.]
MKFVLAAIILSSLYAGPRNSVELLNKMHERYAGKWYKTFTFNQTTERYKNDSLVNKTTWYEALQLPDNFRIDFGDIKEGNAVIFHRDSMYSFRKGQLGRVTVNNDDLTFLLGGMYFYQMDEVLKTITKYGYDLGKFHEDRWKNEKVLVIGADSSGQKTNQLWIDEDKLVLLRFIKYEDGHKEEGIFEDHKKFGGGWSETKCTFYFDDKLGQVEYYHNCRANEPIDPKVFDPASFGKIHWLKGSK